MNSENMLIALIATKPRFDLLFSRSIPSIVSQSLLPKSIVLVADQAMLAEEQQQQLRNLASPVPMHFLKNNGLPGVASTWNTGIDFIREHWPHSYTAILDDDDEWYANHLEVCHQIALTNNNSDIVLSGLRMSIHGVIENQRPITDVDVHDFLAGNPGWQGSNTFVKTRKLIEAGKFTDGLISTNDRDLAIRLLSLDNITVAYTNIFTATWYCENSKEALSAKGSAQKLEGLAQFYRMHRHLMTEQIQARFFARAKSLFQVEPADIVMKAEKFSP